MVSNLEDTFEQPTMNTIPWKESIWFLDIDDTLIDTAGASPQATVAMRKVLERYFDHEVAVKFQDGVTRLFHLVLAGHQARRGEDMQLEREHQRLISSLEKYQQPVREKYGVIKKWSREVFVKLIADEIGVTVTPAMVREAADAYWQTRAEVTHIFPHALTLLRQIREHGRLIFFLTSSDARLTMREDGLFEYDPVYSEERKRERVLAMRKRGLDYDDVSIGDPEDKPHLDFFMKGIRLVEKRLRQKLERGSCIVVGDSFSADLQTPLQQLGFGMGVLFVKGQKKTKSHGNYISTGILSDVAHFLQSQ